METKQQQLKQQLPPLKIKTPSQDKPKTDKKEKKEKSGRKKDKQKTQIKKLEYDIETALNQTDFDDRTILHRACLDQQIKQLQDIIEEIDEKGKFYFFKEKLHQKDKFDCQPLLLCCIKSKISEKVNLREKCLRLLLEPFKSSKNILNQNIHQDYQSQDPLSSISADVNCFNPRTKWTCLHWAAHYGDIASVNLLLHHQIHIFMPDYKGQYPIDLAGKNKHDVVVKKLVEHTIKLLQDCPFRAIEYGPLQIQRQPSNAYFTSLTDEHQKHLLNPLFLCKTIFWAAQYKFDSKDSQLLLMPRSYFILPFKSFKMRTALHAACNSENADFLNQAFARFEQTQFGRDMQKELYKYTKEPTLKLNTAFCFTDNELIQYRDEFKNEVMNFCYFEYKLLPQLKTLVQDKYTNFYTYYVNQQDIYGNSPLHIASIKAFEDGIITLIAKSADMELENNEVFKARELTQDEIVLTNYKDRMLHQTSLDVLTKLKDSLLKQMRGLFAKDDYDRQLRLRNIFGQTLKPKQKGQPKRIMKSFIDDQEQFQDFLKELSIYAQDLFVPDFVLRACTKVKNETDPEASLTRLNFYIQMLQNAKFDVLLMKSQFEQDYYYIMLRHTEQVLEEQADLMNLQMKLMDSYDLEEFQQSFQKLFEPFRSRQRQQIIEKHLRNIKDLDEQIKVNIIEKYYRMHKAGGIIKIKEKWLSDDQKWYFPTPINQISEYLLEGENQNFSSITMLRLYFGEKISFYFAWKSYITCALVALAIPGLAIQIYILATGDYFPAVLPFWVCYVCLWSTLQVEFWKRKTSEITTRWGCLDLLDSKDKGEIRRGFEGYEEIYQVTGELTKHQRKTETFLKSVLSVLVVMIFLGLCVGIFVGVNVLLVKFKGNFIISTGLNIILGIGIFILNLVYNQVVLFSANFENHKYEADYEQSVTFKNSVFTLLNSYLCIFYAAFINGKDFYDILIQLVPVLITKQAQFAALKILLPRLKYSYYEKKYFDQIKSSLINQNQVIQTNETSYKDKIEVLYEQLFKNQTIDSSRRAVMMINLANKESKLEEKVDADQVELNNLKLDYEGTLGYFLEGIIDLGYITLFAAAFPIGPAIAVVASVVEIRTKLFSFLEVYKRPECQRCAGIGDWVNIMQWMGMGSVFSNFALLYAKYKVETVQVIYGYNGEDTDNVIWLFFLTIAIILIIKLAFQWLIPDKPQWVLNELQNIQEKAHVTTGQREALKKTKIIIQEQQAKSSDLRKKLEDIKSQQEAEIESKTRLRDEKLKKIQDFNEAIKSQKEQAKNNNQIKTIVSVQDPKVMKGFKRQRYIEIQHHLLQQRIKQIDLARMNNFFVCNECSHCEAVLECEECEESLCVNCFKTLHAKQTSFTHEVLLLKSVKYFEPQFLGSLKVKRIQKKKKVQVNELQLDGFQPKKWVKFQKFNFPKDKSSIAFQAITSFFQVLQREYSDLSDKERIELTNFYRFRKEGDANFVYYESNFLKEILENTDLNLEEKLWLNRVGFLTLKKELDLNYFKDQMIFFNNQRPIESKMKFLCDLADEDDDDLVSAVDMETLFVPSLVQDQERQFNLSKMIQQSFEKPLTKQEAIRALLSEEWRGFISEFLQYD